LGAGESDVLWWDENGLRHLNAELFVNATRANARATLAALNEGLP
jgi:hypothetical protein